MAEPVSTGKNSGTSRNPAGRAGKNQEDPRAVSKQTQLNSAEVERIDWARQELGLDWSSFLRYAALKVAREVIG